jgi:hypothetical protein
MKLGRKLAVGEVIESHTEEPAAPAGPAAAPAVEVREAAVEQPVVAHAEG